MSSQFSYTVVTILTWSSKQLQHHRLLIMVAPLARRSGRKSSKVSKICSWPWTWEIVVFAMLGNKMRSGVVTSMSYWTSHQSFKVWTRWKSHLHIQKENRKYQERGWLPLWVSIPKQAVSKLKKGKVFHRKCQWEIPF